ncbi:MAG: serine/threonine protein kinase [Phycisphaera sp.]|nr:MAG: serine/threonine protein kinase [Phycisphaera sp.]
MQSKPTKRDLFEQLLNADPARRQLLLKELTTEDHQLWAEMQQLLVADQQAIPDSSFVISDLRELAQKAWGNPDSLTTPESIDGHRVIRRLGAGGMGIVFEIEWGKNQRAAMKLLHPALCSNQTIARFLQEAEAIGRCDHQYVTKIYAYGHTDLGFGSQPYLVLELVDGIPISDTAPSMPLRERLAVLTRVGEGISSIHSKGVVHGDLKPSNILVCPDGMPRILDFGMARSINNRTFGAEQCTWDWAGTLQYMSPEQLGVGSWPIDHRSDLYSFGLVMYEMLAGSVPYKLKGQTVGQAMKTVSTVSIPRIRATPGVDCHDLTRLIRRALCLNPADRYQSATELVQELERIRDGRPPTRMRLPLVQLHHTVYRHALRFSRKRPALVTLCAALGILFIGFWLLQSTTHSKSSTDLEQIGALARAINKDGSPLEAEELLTRYQSASLLQLPVNELRSLFQFYSSWHRWPDLLALTQRASDAISASVTRVGADHLTVVYTYKAKAHLNLGQESKASRALDIALESAEASDGSMLTNISTLLLQLRRTTESLELAKNRLEQLSPLDELSGAPHAHTRVYGILVCCALMEDDNTAYEQYMSLYIQCSLQSRVRYPPWRRLRSMGELDRCERFIQDFIARTNTASASHETALHAQRAAAFRDLGSLRYLDRKYNGAAQAFSDAIELYLAAGDPYPFDRVACIQSLGVCLRDQGKTGEALHYLRQALAHYKDKLSSDYPRLAESEVTLARCLYLAGKYDEADALAAKALEYFGEDIHTHRMSWCESAVVQALVHIENDNTEEAGLLLGRVGDRLTPESKLSPRLAEIFEYAAGRHALACGNPARAKELLGQAIAKLRVTHEPTYPWLALAEHWLIQVELAIDN